MTWNKESRMLTNSLANSSYVYNGFDARVSKTVSSTTTTFKRAGADPVSPVLSDVAGSTTTNYLPGISSRVGSTSTFSHSGIKNGILQTNSSQSNTATKRYDAFGNELSTSGTWQTRFDYGGKFGYQQDDETAYKLLGHRYYDPKIGRFLARDPIKDGRNWYAYAEGNPARFADPDGLQTLDTVTSSLTRNPRGYKEIVELALEGTLASTAVVLTWISYEKWNSFNHTGLQVAPAEVTPPMEVHGRKKGGGQGKGPTRHDRNKIRERREGEKARERKLDEKKEKPEVDKELYPRGPNRKPRDEYYRRGPKGGGFEL
jgi:RHS repeat-associated protein